MADLRTKMALLGKSEGFCRPDGSNSWVLNAESALNSIQISVHDVVTAHLDCDHSCPWAVF